ncbi:MAG: response regulator [Polyangiaceae bacterium]
MLSDPGTAVVVGPPPRRRPSEFGFHEAPTVHDEERPRSIAADAPLVLVVDDDEDMRSMVGTSLELMHYRVIAESDGQRGLTAALEHRPFAAIVDIGMPDLDGIELTRRIKADPRGRGIFVVAMTAHGTRLFERAVDRGCDAYFCKPFNPFTLDLVLRVARARPRKGEATATFKACACGKVYTFETWRELPICGLMRVPGRRGAIELRNCPCGSSLGVDLGADEADVEE